MKYSYIFIALALIAVFAITQTDLLESPESISSHIAGEDAEDMYYIVDLNSLEEISSMFSVTDDNFCLIDFSFADDEVANLTLTKDDKVAYEESLVDMPMEGILEFDLNDTGLEAGTYTLNIATKGDDAYTRIVEIL